MAPDLFELASEGAALALALRFLLDLDVGPHWAVLVGALSLVAQPWLSDYFNLSLWAAAYSQAQFLIGGAVTLAVLGIGQIVRNP